jgi:hypothetical protein
MSGMAAELINLELSTRLQWRNWLSKHRASSPGVWLVFHKEHTGRASITYEDLSGKRSASAGSTASSNGSMTTATPVSSRRG